MTLTSERKFDALYINLGKEFKVLFGISLGVFLFVLFFQPFEIKTLDFNNTLLIKSGLGGIVFVTMVGARAFRVIRQSMNNGDISNFYPFISGFLIFILNSVAFAFYLRYVGGVEISFYIMFKVILINFFPPMVLGLNDMINMSREQNELLLAEIRQLQSRDSITEAVDLQKVITITSENVSDKIDLAVTDLVMIKSADNYVELIYLDDDNYAKKLIRNTLNNIEFQLRSYTNFKRCHRTCLINLIFIENLKRESNNYWLIVKNSKEKVPISRQYLIPVKEAMLSD